MKERQGGQSRNIKQESGCIVGMDIYGGLILDTLENTEGDTGHQTVIDHGLGEHGLLGAVLEDKERDHLRKLLRETHTEDISHNTQRECHLGKDIEEVQTMQQSEDEEDTCLREEECPYGCAGVNLTRGEEVVEEQPPYHCKIQ